MHEICLIRKIDFFQINDLVDKRDNTRPTQTTSHAASLPFVDRLLSDFRFPKDIFSACCSPLIVVHLLSGKRPSMVLFKPHLVVNNLIMSCRASWPGEKALGW